MTFHLDVDRISRTACRQIRPESFEIRFYQKEFLLKFAFYLFVKNSNRKVNVIKITENIVKLRLKIRKTSSILREMKEGNKISGFLPYLLFFEYKIALDTNNK